MKELEKTDRYFFVLVPIGMLFSIFFTSLVSFHAKNELTTKFQGLEFIVESNTPFDATLYYTYDTEFSASYKLATTGFSKDTLIFVFPKKQEIVKKFRLDLGNDPKLKEVKIKTLFIIFENKRIRLDEEAVYQLLFLNSASTRLNRSGRTIEIKNFQTPFDPYVVFIPIAAITLTDYTYLVGLLAPFLFLFVFYQIRPLIANKITPLKVLLLLFIVSIPLKIAWTTFCTLLLGAYGIIRSMQKKEVRVLNSAFYLFSALFCALVLFGRPNGIYQIDKYWALPLFALVSLLIALPKQYSYRQFVYFMLLFNALMVSAGVTFLLWFHEFYALDASDYFKDIKIYSGFVRDWLYYDHAAFLSFFGLTGMLFAHALYQKQRLGKKALYVYDSLLLLFIVLMGSRVCLVIYGVFLLNVLTPWKNKRSVFINSLLFISIAMMLVYTIKKTDPTRYQLWSVSWQAIKEKPWFGHGMGSSDKLLHDSRIIHNAGFANDLDFNHPHNQFISFLLEIGVLGTLAIFMIVVFWLYKTKQHKNEIMVLFLVGLGYLFLTESILETSKPLYIICFLFLLIANEDKKLKIK
jgi:O-antigen ligase